MLKECFSNTSYILFLSVTLFIGRLNNYSLELNHNESNTH